MNTQANIERLELLATALEQQKFTAPAKFDLNDWLKASSDLPTTGELAERDDGSKVLVVDPTQVHCGAAACACGHAALMPEFRAQGFKLVTPIWGARVAQPFFEGVEGWSAVQRFFGLEHDWASYLFNAEHYDEEDGVEHFDEDEIAIVTPDLVAKRIRAFVKDERLSHQMGLPGAR
jgi:hypothetical protein